MRLCIVIGIAYLAAFAGGFGIVRHIDSVALRASKQRLIWSFDVLANDRARDDAMRMKDADEWIDRELDLLQHRYRI